MLHLSTPPWEYDRRFQDWFSTEGVPGIPVLVQYAPGAAVRTRVCFFAEDKPIFLLCLVRSSLPVELGTASRKVRAR